MGDHRLGQCVKCTREDVEIAAFDLCFACYRAEQRTKERGGASLQRALNRQPAQLIKHYSALVLAIATIDMSDAGDSGLMTWVIERVEALVEPIRDYVVGQPTLTLKSLPDRKKLFKAFHEVTVRLMGLGASREMISEIHERVRSCIEERLSAESAALAPSPQNQCSRSRSEDTSRCSIVPFPQPPPA